VTVAEDDKPLLLSLQQKETALALLAADDWQNEGL
jgi:PHD/YefM family antitoxin component YafN of YafNO toxin-antitoxin module